MKKIFTKTTGFLLGIFCIGGIVYAATSLWNINDIEDKKVGRIVSSEEFNKIVNTLRNIHNDGTNIGINQPNPEYTLDVNGDVIVRDILEKPSNYTTLGCSTLGTDETGKLKCKPTYHWVYSAWSNCKKPCGGGTKTRTINNCERDDGQIVDNSYCTESPSLKTSCNTQPCCTKVDSYWKSWQNYDKCKYYSKGELGAPSSGMWQPQVSYCVEGSCGGTKCNCANAPADAATCSWNSAAYKFSSTCSVGQPKGTWSPWYGPYWTSPGHGYYLRSCSVNKSCTGSTIFYF